MKAKLKQLLKNWMCSYTVANVLDEGFIEKVKMMLLK